MDLVAFFHKARKLQAGLTIAELTVVIAIIGILSTFAISYINPIAQVNKGNDAKRKSDIHTIQAALEIYRADAGFYPTLLYSTDCSTSSSLTYGTTTYLQKVPCDPTRSGSAANYSYTASPSGCNNSGGNYCTGYTLYGCLDSTNDPQGVTNSNCTSGYSYSVTNP